MVIMDQRSNEHILLTIQDIDKTILKITESIQVLRNAENILSLVRYTFIYILKKKNTNCCT